MANIETLIQIEYKGKNGRWYKRTIKPKSYVRAFIDILATQIRQTSPASGGTDTGNAARTLAAHANSFAVTGAAATITDGIVVGTGTNAVAVTQYALQTIVGHGTSGGQLVYGSTAFTDPVTNGSSREFVMTRSFSNYSGSSINIKEIGIYVKATATPYYFMIERTLADFTIDNGSTATVAYIIRITV